MVNTVCVQEDEYLCYAWKVPDVELYIGRWHCVCLTLNYTLSQIENKTPYSYW